MLGVIILAAAATAYPSQIDNVGGGGDTLRIESAGAGAELTYGNTEYKSSIPGLYTLEINGIVVDVLIEILNGPERITVRPRDPGLIAVPESIEVNDGDFTVIQITPPMF